MKFEIKNRWSGELIIAVEAENWRSAVEAAIKQNADLTDADLTGVDLTRANLTRANLTRADLTDANLTDADLTDANLTDANLTDADLTDANLTDANLTDANLTDADLTDADLTDANLTRADLTDADLTGVDLTRANLTRANLTRADLTDANLTDANLRVIKHDVWGVLLQAIPEVPFLRQALIDGKVNGSTYSGECACLCGTIANAQGKQSGEELPFADSSSPAERFFMGIKEGDTPSTNPISKIALEWVDEFLKLTGKQALIDNQK